MLKRALKLILGILGILMWISVFWSPARSGIGSAINSAIPFLGWMPIQLGILILAGIFSSISNLASKYLVDWRLIRRLRELQYRLIKETISGKAKRVELLKRELDQLRAQAFSQQLGMMIYGSALVFPVIIWGWAQAEMSIHLAQDQIREILEMGIGIDANNLTEIQRSWNGPMDQLSKLARKCPLDGMEALDECLKSKRIRLEPYMELPMMGRRSLEHRVFGLVPYWLVWFSLCYTGFYELSRKLLKVGK